MITVSRRVDMNPLLSLVFDPDKIAELISAGLEMVKETVPLLYQDFKAPNEVEYRVEPFFDPTTGTLGATYWSNDDEQTVLVTSINLASVKIVETLAHEFTHGDQLHSGRLKVKQDSLFWEGRPAEYSDPNGGEFTSKEEFDKYEASPWEVEARAGSAAFLARHQIDPENNRMTRLLGLTNNHDSMEDTL